MRRLNTSPAEGNRHRAVARRDDTDLLRRHADWLTGVDRTLLTLYLQAGCSFQQLGRLTGMNRSSVCRRIRKILRRLSDRTYLTCLASRDRFSDQEIEVLRDHLIRGLSLARIARDSGLRYYRVRAILDKAKDLSQPARS